MIRGFASSWRLWFLSAGVLAAFGGIGFRLVQLHVIDREELLQYVEKARNRVVVESGRRGDVLDLNGHILATSRTLLDVGVDPQAIRPEDRPKWPELAWLLGLSPEELERRMARRTVRTGVGGEVRLVRWTSLADEVEESVYEQVLRLGVRGVYGNRTYRRVYPGGSLASHTIGFLNRENTPVTGIERHYDFYLRGRDGWRESERDGLGGELAQFRSREVPPEEGYSVVLSIDSVVQHIVEEELEEIARRFNPDGAVIIVSEPATGFILGMANYPTFDLNAFNRAPIDHQRNRAVTDMFEPGSTFKIVAASAALEEGLVTPSTQFDCGIRTLVYRGTPRPLPRDSREYGILSVADIVGKSSNIGAAHLGVLLGERRLYEYSRNFGFGETSGYSLGGEVAGILHPVSRWDGLTVTRLPMGHAVAATPLQVHFAMGAVANRGVLMTPRLVAEIRDPNGEVVHQILPEPRRRVVSGATADLMSRLLARVASAEGTAPSAAIPGFDVAGKTGTTQKIIDGKYSNRHHVGSFIGYFPASNPRLLITVIVDNARPPNGGTAYGTTVAVPSFRRISDQLIQYLGIRPASGASTFANLPGDSRDWIR